MLSPVLQIYRIGKSGVVRYGLLFQAYLLAMGQWFVKSSPQDDPKKRKNDKDKRNMDI